LVGNDCANGNARFGHADACPFPMHVVQDLAEMRASFGQVHFLGGNRRHGVPTLDRDGEWFLPSIAPPDHICTELYRCGLAARLTAPPAPIDLGQTVTVPVMNGSPRGPRHESTGGAR